MAFEFYSRFEKKRNHDTFHQNEQCHSSSRRNSITTKSFVCMRGMPEESEKNPLSLAHNSISTVSIVSIVDSAKMFRDGKKTSIAWRLNSNVFVCDNIVKWLSFASKQGDSRRVCEKNPNCIGNRKKASPIEKRTTMRKTNREKKQPAQHLNFTR